MVIIDLDVMIFTIYLVQTSHINYVSSQKQTFLFCLDYFDDDFDMTSQPILLWDELSSRDNKSAFRCRDTANGGE